jgi:hypothetical protein
VGRLRGHANLVVYVTRSPDYDEGYRAAIEEAAYACGIECDMIGAATGSSIDAALRGAADRIRSLTPPRRPETAACRCFEYWVPGQLKPGVRSDRCPLHGSAAKPAVCARCNGDGQVHGTVGYGIGRDWVPCPECKGGA